MRPIAPRVGEREVMVAEEQPEYLPITVAIIDHSDGGRSILTRWTMTEDERQRVARGEDIYVSQLNFGNPMTPISVSVGYERG